MIRISTNSLSTSRYMILEWYSVLFDGRTCYRLIFTSAFHTSRRHCTVWFFFGYIGRSSSPRKQSIYVSCIKNVPGIFILLIYDAPSLHHLKVEDRLASINQAVDNHPNIIRPTMITCQSFDHFRTFYEEAVRDGHAGVVLRKPESFYFSSSSYCIIREYFLTEVKDMYKVSECKDLSGKR